MRPQLKCFSCFGEYTCVTTSGKRPQPSTRASSSAGQSTIWRWSRFSLRSRGTVSKNSEWYDWHIFSSTCGSRVKWIVKFDWWFEGCRMFSLDRSLALCNFLYSTNCGKNIVQEEPMGKSCFLLFGYYLNNCPSKKSFTDNVKTRSKDLIDHACLADL